MNLWKKVPMQAAARISCADMPELIVRYAIRDLPDDQGHEVERYFQSCSECYAKLLALEVALELNTSTDANTLG
jgi:hypothetical protein